MGLNPRTVSGWSSEQMRAYMAGLESGMVKHNSGRPGWEADDLAQIDDAMGRIVDIATSVSDICAKLMTAKAGR